MTEDRASTQTILLVEDEEDIRVLYRTFLEMKGYRVVEAVDGEEAVEVARRERPRLILMDLNLPKLNGVAAARRIRQFPELRDVPIVTNSAYGASGIDLFLHIDELGEGFTDYITKPVNFAELEDLLNRLLRES